MNFRRTIRRLDRWGLSRRKLRGGRLHAFLGDRLLERDLWIPSRESTARAWLIGMIVTAFPFLPLQSLVAGGIGFLARANLPVCIALQYLSNPATAIVQIPACFLAGRLLMGGPLQVVMTEARGNPMVLVSGSNLVAVYLGACVLGPVLGVAGYLLTHLVWREKPAKSAASSPQA